MDRARVAARFAAAGLGVLALIAATMMPAAATVEPTSSITIHNRICPTEYDGSDFFGDCHDNPQTSNLEFTIDGPVTDTRATDNEGNVVFPELPGGTYQISGGVPGEFADTFVYCSDAADPGTVFVSTTALIVSLDLPDVTDVICDWYNIPVDLSGNGDDGTDDGDDTGTPPTLPTTGVGSAVSAGTLGGPLGLLAIVGLATTSLALRRRMAA